MMKLFFSLMLVAVQGNHLDYLDCDMMNSSICIASFVWEGGCSDETAAMPNMACAGVDDICNPQIEKWCVEHLTNATDNCNSSLSSLCIEQIVAGGHCEDVMNGGMPFNSQSGMGSEQLDCSNALMCSEEIEAACPGQFDCEGEFALDCVTAFYTNFDCNSTELDPLDIIPGKDCGPVIMCNSLLDDICRDPMDFDCEGEFALDCATAFYTNFDCNSTELDPMDIIPGKDCGPVVVCNSLLDDICRDPVDCTTAFARECATAFHTKFDCDDHEMDPMALIPGQDCSRVDECQDLIGEVCEDCDGTHARHCATAFLNKFNCNDTDANSFDPMDLIPGKDCKFVGECDHLLEDICPEEPEEPSFWVGVENVVNIDFAGIFSDEPMMGGW